MLHFIFWDHLNWVLGALAVAAWGGVFGYYAWSIKLPQQWLARWRDPNRW